MFLDKEKVLKLEVCTVKGNILLTVTKNFTFPYNMSPNEDRSDIIIIKSKNLPVFARGANVSVVTYTRAGERVSYPGRIEVSAEQQLNIKLFYEDSKLLDERRRFYKVFSETTCAVTSITRNERHLELNPPLVGVITNINIGGVFLKINTKIELQMNDVIAILMEGLIGVDEITAKILRVQFSPEGQLIGYGCCFLFLNLQQEETIAKFVNKLQIEQRAMEKALIPTQTLPKFDFNEK